MSSFETSATVEEQGRVRVAGVPFPPGTEVEVKEAVRLNQQNVKAPPKPKMAQAELVVPDYLQAALKKHRAAGATFAGLSPSHRREYVQWITEARQETTRQKRLATAIEWLSEGKPRHGKYTDGRR